MTREEFQKKYHDYQTHSEEEAKREADLVNEQGIERGIAIAVSFGDLGCV